MITSRHRIGDCNLAVFEDGEGLPLLFQHGLCGDQAQPEQVFPHGFGFRRITVECRGHGASEPGPDQDFSISRFTADIVDFIEASDLRIAIAGGISMGAAIALRLAVHRPDLVQGLVIARPAWLCDSNPPNMAPNLYAGQLLHHFPADDARRRFEESDMVRDLAQTAPDNLASLRGFFSRQPSDVTSALLRKISADGPGVSEQAIRAIAVPALVIGHGRDAVHPLAYAKTLANWIPGATFVEITPKAENPAAYRTDFRAAISNFLKEF